MITLPSPRTPDPYSAPVLRWGIMGPGGIAQQFTATLQKYTRQRVVAVGSRNKSRADEFARQWSIPAAHGSYADPFCSRQMVDSSVNGMPKIDAS